MPLAICGFRLQRAMPSCAQRTIRARRLTSLDWSLRPSYAGNSERRENHYQENYTVFSHEGKHLWKVGGTVNRIRLAADIPDGFDSVYLFGSLGDFLAGI